MPQELCWEMEWLNHGTVAHTEAITMEIDSTLEQEILKGQESDGRIKEIKTLIKMGKAPSFIEDNQGTVWFKSRICVCHTWI